MPNFYNQTWTNEEINTSFKRPVKQTSIVDQNAWKLLFFRILIVLVLGAICISLINLQVVNGQSLKELSDKNRIFAETIPAPRGIIYDRNGVPLVYNKDTFKVVINTHVFDDKNKGLIFSELADILHISRSAIERQYADGTKQYSSFITIQDDISRDAMIAITTNPDMKGIEVDPTVIREYPYKDILSHVLGYVGNVSADDEKTNTSLDSQDTIGKDGIEYEYDKYLRGTDGKDIVEVDTNGQKVNTITTQDPVAGDNIYLSIDVNLQKTLFDDIAKGTKDSSATGGAGIIEDTQDGSILAIDSFPSYDNNLFSIGISQQDYHNLLTDPNNPLINRAVSEAQPPGSIMKTITGSAALQEKAISSDTIFHDKGTFDYGGTTFQNYNKRAYGDLNVVGGIQWSSNIFFYNTMLNLGENNFIKYAKLFGAGSLTGIDLPGEVKGELSTPAVKQSLTGQVWYGGDSLNAAIGQGYTLVTPIQIANWITSIANGGTLFVPRVVSRIADASNSVIKDFGANILRQNFVSDQNLATIREGMHQAVQNGIDVTMKTSVVDIGGKTGTAEFGDKDSNGNYTHEHAWASGFAPFNKPQIAFVLFLEGGGLSSHAELVEKNFLNWYYGDYLKNNPGIL